jgi:hypothetical protein
MLRSPVTMSSMVAASRVARVGNIALRHLRAEASTPSTISIQNSDICFLDRFITRQEYLADARNWNNTLRLSPFVGKA